ncbi:MAG: hypothetical protein DHS20C09_11390 [marine bacterium B5-7]|nr:MAG: hypothetical protein DHS20C09_11390 [marine bacterium B5-7]
MLLGVQAVQANTGKAFNIKGKVVVNGEPLTLATTLKEGDVILTGEKSSVKVVMKDGTVLDISENTAFAIDKYAYKAEAPEESSSAFSLLGGAFRYVSGLIAKKDPTKTRLTAGTATIGIRGTFVDVTSPLGLQTLQQLRSQYPAADIELVTVGTVTGSTDGAGDTLAVRTSIGEATITLPDGTTLNVVAGQIGTINTTTGAASTAAAAPDPIAAAAIAMANDPENAAAAIADMSDADAALVIAALVNNATQLGATKEAVLAAVSKAVASKPSIAVGAAYITSALSPADAATFTATITAAAPEQAAAIEAASNSGKTLETAPATASIFNLRVATDGSGDVIVTNEDGSETRIENTNTGGSPLTTEQIQEALEAINSPSG